MAHPRRRTGQKHREPQRSRFRDRTGAGYAVAERLGAYQGRPDSVVVGLVPGMAVAATMGAIAEDGDAQLNPAVRVALAAPVAPPATGDRVSDMVDELVVLETSLAFRGVSPFYGNFRPESEAEVRELLAADRPSRLSTRFAGNGVSHGPQS